MEPSQNSQLIPQPSSPQPVPTPPQIHKSKINPVWASVFIVVVCAVGIYFFVKVVPHKTDIADTQKSTVVEETGNNQPTFVLKKDDPTVYAHIIEEIGLDPKDYNLTLGYYDLDPKHSSLIPKGDITFDGIDDLIFIPLTSLEDDSRNENDEFIDVPIIILEGKGNDTYGIFATNITTGFNPLNAGAGGDIEVYITPLNTFSIETRAGSCSGSMAITTFIKKGTDFIQNGSRETEYDNGCNNPDGEPTEDTTIFIPTGELFVDYDFSL